MDELQDLRRRLVVGHKADGRSLYDQQAKAELVALCMQPGASVSRLARVLKSTVSASRSINCASGLTNSANVGGRTAGRACACGLPGG